MIRYRVVSSRIERPCVSVLSAAIAPLPPSKLKLQAPPRACTSFSISPEKSESPKEKALITPPLKAANGWATCFLRACPTSITFTERYKRTFLNLLNFAAAHAVTFSSVPCHYESGRALVNIFPALTLNAGFFLFFFFLCELVHAKVGRGKKEKKNQTYCRSKKNL